MPAFADASVLAEFTGDESLDSARGTMLLESASAIIRNHCRQQFDLVEDDEVELRGTWSNRLLLPERPVVSVTSAAIDGTDVAFHRVRDQLFRGAAGAWNIRTKSDRGHWGGPQALVTVVYTHGFEEIPGAIEAVCLQVAARAAHNPSSYGNVTIGGFRAGGMSQPLTLTAAEQATLDRFKHEHATA